MPSHNESLQNVLNKHQREEKKKQTNKSHVMWLDESESEEQKAEMQLKQ